MVFDHLGEFFSFLGIPLWFHWIGRVTAPIFLFESSEGFIHTSNRKKYMFRLLIGFWIMGLVNMVLNRYFSVGDAIVINNIFSTLFLGTVYMQAVEYLRNGMKERRGAMIGKSLLWFFAPLLVSLLPLWFFMSLDLSQPLAGAFIQIFTLLIPTLFFTEGGFLFVLLAVCFYLFHGKKGLQVAALVLVAVITFVTGDMQQPFASNYQWMMMFAAIPVILYNGEKGRSMRSFFYYFYIGHIALFAIVSFLIQR